MGDLRFMIEFLKEAEELAKELGEPLYLTKEEIYKRDMEEFKEQEKIRKQDNKANFPKEKNKK